MIRRTSGGELGGMPEEVVGKCGGRECSWPRVWVAGVSCRSSYQPQAVEIQIEVTNWAASRQGGWMFADIALSSTGCAEDGWMN